MKSLKSAKVLLALAALVLFSQVLGYAQAPFAVVAAADPGFARPHVWWAGAVGDPGAVHGPGDPNCGTADQCFYNPFDINTAYATAFIPNNNGGAGRTVAIVDAFDSPNAEADLGNFSAAFGLPPCTTLNGCFKKVNQTGAMGPYPPFNGGWAVEIGLDVQWVHAIAPNAKILLIETNDNSFANLGAGVLLGQVNADVVSNSYGANEFAGETGFDGFYAGSAVPILFSSGDTGAVTEYPCTSSFAVCVGGTSLVETATSFRNVERAWSGSGGGCSSQVGVAAWEAPYSSGVCGGARGVPDIAGPADPNTGGEVYYSPPVVGVAGFYIVGGTSWACPVNAGIVALLDASRAASGKGRLGGPASANYLQMLEYNSAGAPFYNYRWYDVTSGSSGFPAVPGWDRATGLGVARGPADAFYFNSLP